MNRQQLSQLSYAYNNIPPPITVQSFEIAFAKLGAGYFHATISINDLSYIAFLNIALIIKKSSSKSSTGRNSFLTMNQSKSELAKNKRMETNKRLLRQRMMLREMQKEKAKKATLRYHSQKQSKLNKYTTKSRVQHRNGRNKRRMEGGQKNVVVVNTCNPFPKVEYQKYQKEVVTYQSGASVRSSQQVLGRNGMFHNNNLSHISFGMGKQRMVPQRPSSVSASYSKYSKGRKGRSPRKKMEVTAQSLAKPKALTAR